MDWSIQHVARIAGTTSRTLRHYDDIGLLPPTRIGSNGYRRYDGQALVRLQRILLLRDLGLGLPEIADRLDAGGDDDDATALVELLNTLRQQQRRLALRVAAVERVINASAHGGRLAAEEILGGFDAGAA